MLCNFNTVVFIMFVFNISVSESKYILQVVPLRLIINTFQTFIRRKNLILRNYELTISAYIAGEPTENA